MEYNRFDTGPNEYRASTAPIRKCPVEVLLMIFEFSSAGDSENNMELLPVCKWWYTIAMNTPRLWTHICIEVKPAKYERLESLRDKQHIKTCLRRSASLPLHILLDLKLMQLNQARGLRNVPDVISVLVGTNGMHMSRWKTLRIFFPPFKTHVKMIWQLFRGPSPHLTRLFISGPELRQSDLVSSSSVSFPDLSSLEDLTIQVEVTDIEFLGLPFLSIKRLDLDIDVFQSSQISRFTHLEYLQVLFFTQALTNTDSAADAVSIINLPLLQDLTYHLFHPRMVEWHIPILQRFKIIGYFNDRVDALPDVRALQVCWRIGQTEYTTELESTLLRTLQTIISKYSDMREITMRPLLQPIWDKCVQSLSEEKRLALPTIVFD